ncbi:hypothetical protein BJ508DRAFT_313515 [Ascobolus immersus RN42]|uniref:Extracellular membrane protein CFEM domain-containing protein n=1 Tax=Ascobolus immersus RN42 TaxID=1160509 RepID=A0A3N4HLH0_ASCIM|nr:hypothetical protein BJ508DRAFT_313515 [Ascobolus immersus RN42]
MKLTTPIHALVFFNAIFLVSPAIGQVLNSLTELRGFSSCSRSCFQDFSSTYPSDVGCGGPDDWPCLCETGVQDFVIKIAYEAGKELGLCIVESCGREQAQLEIEAMDTFDATCEMWRSGGGSSVGGSKGSDTGTGVGGTEKNLKSLKDTLKDLEETTGKGPGQGLLSGSSRVHSNPLTLGSLVGILSAVMMWNLY